MSQRDEAAPVAVTVLTGFLGAGKTTLLNRILTEDHGERVAVLVNEFGDVPVDGKLVVGTEEEVIELANGCLCCTVRADLVESLGALLDRRERRLFARRFERLVIETSGLASPGPLLQTLALEGSLASRCEVAGVVALAHAVHLDAQLELHPEVAEQLGYADLVLLNHADEVGEGRLEQLERSVRARTPLAAVRPSVRGDVPLVEVLSPTRTERMTPAEADAPPHTEGAGSVVLRSRAPLDLHRLKIWLQFVSAKRDHELWRMKGVVACTGLTHGTRVQAVYQVLEIGPDDASPPSESALVLIGRGFDEAELRRGWAACGGDGSTGETPGEPGRS